MNTTALGLIVAIPCMIMYSIMGSKSNTIIEEIDEFSPAFKLPFRPAQILIPGVLWLT